MIPKFNTKLVPLVDHPLAQGYSRTGLHFKSTIPTLSTALEGFERGELVAITAPPGAGKTQLARTICLDLVNQGVNCLYVSYELTYAQLLRMFNLAGLEGNRNKKLILSPLEHSENDITFIEEIAKQDIAVLVVDDIHSLEEKYSGVRKTDNMAVVMRGLAQRLKTLAIKNDIVVITMAHMRKDAIDSSSSSLSEIAYSGGIAQVADTVLSIKTDKKTGYAVIEITKSRWAGKKLSIRAESQNKRFVEIDDKTPDEIVNSFRLNSQKELPVSSV